MPNVGNATHEELCFLLTHFYPGISFYLPVDPTYEGLTILPNSSVPKPPLQELIDHIPEARQIIAQRRAYQEKVSAFQQTYPVQDQIVNLISAIYDPATTNIATLKANATLTAMKNLWQSL